MGDTFFIRKHGKKGFLLCFHVHFPSVSTALQLFLHTAYCLKNADFSIGVIGICQLFHISLCQFFIHCYRSICCTYQPLMDLISVYRYRNPMHIIGKCQVGIGIQFFCFFVESLIVRKDLRFFIIFSSGQIKLSLSGRYCFPDRFYRIFLMDHTSFYFREHLVSLFLWKIIGQLRIHRSNLLLQLEETHSIYLCSKCLLIDLNTACQFILKSLKKADRPHPRTLSAQI